MHVRYELYPAFGLSPNLGEIQAYLFLVKQALYRLFLPLVMRYNQITFLATLLCGLAFPRMLCVPDPGSSSFRPVDVF